MPIEVPASTMNNAAAPAHTHAAPAVAANRTRQQGTPGPVRGPVPAPAVTGADPGAGGLPDLREMRR